MNKKAQKRIFWEALVLSLFVFGLGITLGFFIENSRSQKIDLLYTYSETELLDVRLQSDIFGLALVNCNDSINENMKFADKVYEEAKMLTEYEDAQRLSDSLILQHKKYDLLRASIWINSIKIKENCNASYHNIIYFYQYNEPDVNKKAEQEIFSRVLEEVKSKNQEKVLLLPIAGDLGEVSIQALEKQYNITSLPTVLIDEKVKITELETSEQLEKYFS